jgi:hypothetical protein
MKIMIKEYNVDGEEVVRHGQLNLVDLAGYVKCFTDTAPVTCVLYISSVILFRVEDST